MLFHASIIAAMIFFSFCIFWAVVAFGAFSLKKWVVGLVVAPYAALLILSFLRVLS